MRALPLAAAVLLGCSPPSSSVAPSQDWSGDLLATDLQVDLGTLEGTATLRLDTLNPTASLEAGGLDIRAVRSEGAETDWVHIDGRLDVAIPQRTGAVDLEVDYAFFVAEPFEGLMATGSSLTWPDHCGNLFPCRSDPADGVRFRLQLDGAPAGHTVVQTPAVPFDAPAYQLAWAVGDYTEVDIGLTESGTRVVGWHLPGGADDLAAGTADLVGVVTWLEQRLGPYPFGDALGPVAVDWGPSAFGGMEHHPFWHVAASAMSDPVVQAHEAVHGWFGDGVRLACWEDLVLSEGVATYLAARALGVVAGSEVEEAVWADYAATLADVFVIGDRVVLPGSCGDVDVDELFGNAVYMKPAFFLRAVADEAGAEVLDEALGVFARERLGEAARMQDLLDTIDEITGFDPTELADAWLRGTGDPRQ